MRSSDFNNFLTNNISSQKFIEIIQDNVASYSILMTKIGSIIPLYFQEDEAITLNSSTVKKLLNQVLNGNLNSVHLAYICDCLTLGEDVDFEDEKVKEIIFTIADPEINGGFQSKEDLMKLNAIIQQAYFLYLNRFTPGGEQFY